MLRTLVTCIEPRQPPIVSVERVQNRLGCPLQTVEQGGRTCNCRPSIPCTQRILYACKQSHPLSGFESYMVDRSWHWYTVCRPDFANIQCTRKHVYLSQLLLFVQQFAHCSLSVVLGARQRYCNRRCNGLCRNGEDKTNCLSTHYKPHKQPSRRLDWMIHSSCTTRSCCRTISRSPNKRGKVRGLGVAVKCVDSARNPRGVW